jgi:hypothetical protein
VQHGTPIPPVQPLKDDEKAAFYKAGKNSEPDYSRKQSPEFGKATGQ